MENLDRNVAIEMIVVGSPHFTHAAFTDSLDKAVMAELRSFFDPRWRDGVVDGTTPLPVALRTRNLRGGNLPSHRVQSLLNNRLRCPGPSTTLGKPRPTAHGLVPGRVRVAFSPHAAE